MSRWKLNPSRSHPGSVVLIGPYNDAFLEAFKAAVHPWHREWVPALLAWRITGDEAISAARGVIARFEEPSP